MSNAIEDIKKYKNIHFIGIGGVSMSGIAETIRNLGVQVTGSDCSRSEITDRLISHGIKVTIRKQFRFDPKCRFSCVYCCNCKG